MSQACLDYADQVQAAHEAMDAVLDEILAMILEGAVISGLLAGISGGLAAFGGAGVVSAKIAAKAPKLQAIATVLVETAGVAASTVRTAGQGLSRRQTKLTKFARARAKLRDERGSIALGGGASAASRDFFRSIDKRGWLDAHEHSKRGHTKARHIGKTDDELRERFVKEKYLKESSTYVDQKTAERAISRAIRDNRDEFERWVRDPTDEKFEFEGLVDKGIGRVMDKSGTIHPPSRIRVVLIKDENMDNGVRLLTSFPMP